MLEVPEPDVMQRPPRDATESIMTPANFKRITCESAVIASGVLGAYGYGLARYGPGASASTLALMSLTSGQLLHMLSCRSHTHSLFEPTEQPPNPGLTAAWAARLSCNYLPCCFHGPGIL